MSSGSSRLLLSGVKNARSKVDTRPRVCLKNGISPLSSWIFSSPASTSYYSDALATSPVARRRISPPSPYLCRMFSAPCISYNLSDPSASAASVITLSRDQQSEADRARWATTYLRETFPSLPGEFPPGVAKRIMTHMSYRPGAQTYGHNARLSFLGRRVLKAYLLMYLQSSLPEEVMLGPGVGQMGAALGAPRDVGAMGGLVDFDEFIESALDTRALGERVATAWRLENGVRWTSAIPPTLQTPSSLTERSYQKGKAKVMGTTVEAIVGGVFHQFGGMAAFSLFHTYVLPYLNVPTSSVPFRSDSEAGSKTSERAPLVGDHFMVSPQKRRAVA